MQDVAIRAAEEGWGGREEEGTAALDLGAAGARSPRGPPGPGQAPSHPGSPTAPRTTPSQRPDGHPARPLLG